MLHDEHLVRLEGEPGISRRLFEEQPPTEAPAIATAMVDMMATCASPSRQTVDHRGRAVIPLTADI